MNWREDDGAVPPPRQPQPSWEEDTRGDPLRPFMLHMLATSTSSDDDATVDAEAAVAERLAAGLTELDRLRLAFLALGVLADCPTSVLAELNAAAEHVGLPIRVAMLVPPSDG